MENVTSKDGTTIGVVGGGVVLEPLLGNPQAKYDARNPVALKQLVGSGAKLRPFPSDLMTEAFKVSMQVYDELSGKNESWKKIYADYSKFRADQNLWFRFTEATFDRFMQAQKL